MPISLRLVVYVNFFCGLRTQSLSSRLVLISHARVCLLALFPWERGPLGFAIYPYRIILFFSLSFSRASPQINWYSHAGTIPPVLRPCHQSEPLHECCFLSFFLSFFVNKTETKKKKYRLFDCLLRIFNSSCHDSRIT